MEQILTANNNQVNVQVSSEGEAVTLTASVLTNQGVLDPINSGHLDIFVSAAASHFEENKIYQKTKLRMIRDQAIINFQKFTQTLLS